MLRTPLGPTTFATTWSSVAGSPLEDLYIFDNVEISNVNSFATSASVGGTVSMLDVLILRPGRR